MLILDFFLFLFFRVFSLLFEHFPSILLHFLRSFQPFLRYCGLLATHFAVFRVISRDSLIFGLFPSILLLYFTFLRCCLLIGYMMLYVALRSL